MNRVSLPLLAALLLTAGCQSKVDNSEAIRLGVVKRITAISGLNVNNMNITLTQVDVHGDTAEACVDIRAKDADPISPPMQLVYQLQKQGQEWVVVKGQAAGGMQHPTSGEIPSQNDLPPGHRPAAGANHSDFNAILNNPQSQSPQPPAQSGSQQQQQQPPQSSSPTYTKP
jgi:hypothetical protein